MDVSAIKDMVDASKDDDIVNKKAEIAFISLACYFEAYFKNQFASIANICPSILNNFISKRPEIAIRVKDLFILDFDIYNKIGFLISEQFDFGTAKIINSLYKDLILITPFSKEDTELYNEFLSQRNLLVHHGGIYTLKYSKQRFAKASISEGTFFNSLIIKKRDFNKWLEFSMEMVTKTNKACHTALKKYIEHNNIVLDEEKLESLEALLWRYWY